MAGYLKENNIKKRISVGKQNFYISDDFGTTRRFQMQPIDKKIFYSIDDIDNFLDAFMVVLTKALSQGEEVSIRGLGSFNLKYYKERNVGDLNNLGAKVKMEGRHVPSFSSGAELKRAARLYTQSLQDSMDRNLFPKEEELISMKDDDYDE